MTRQLFYEDAFLRSFCASVTACQSVGDYYGVELEQTAFFPEGGGQPGDRGTLSYPGGSVRVVDTQWSDGHLLHLCDGLVPVGTSVEGALDWDWRFDLMQQHSGEHLFSGEVHRRFGYDNVGFHMGADTITVDFNGPITWQELLEIEQAVNAAIWRDVPTETFYPADLQREVYRSKKELDGPVRLVRFGPFDTCACCGVHVTRTGQIGLFKVLSVVKFRAGVRVELLCGGRALAAVNEQLAQNRQISQLLSAKPVQTAQAVTRLQQEMALLRDQLVTLRAQRAEAAAQQYADSGNVLLFEPGLSGDSLRRFCLAVAARCGGRCAVFSPQETGHQYVIAAETEDLRPLARQLNQALRGRGGGKPNFVQGAVSATESEIAAWFAALPEA